MRVVMTTLINTWQKETKVNKIRQLSYDIGALTSLGCCLLWYKSYFLVLSIHIYVRHCQTPNKLSVFLSRLALLLFKIKLATMQSCGYQMFVVSQKTETSTWCGAAVVTCCIEVFWLRSNSNCGRLSGKGRTWVFFTLLSFFYVMEPCLLVIQSIMRCVSCLYFFQLNVWNKAGPAVMG